LNLLFKKNNSFYSLQFPQKYEAAQPISSLIIIIIINICWAANHHIRMKDHVTLKTCWKCQNHIASQYHLFLPIFLHQINATLESM